MIERTGSELHITNRNQRNSSCYIALASDAEDHFSSTGSLLVDCSNALMKQYRNTIARRRSELREISKERTEALEWKNAQVADLEAGVQSSQQALEWRQSQISKLQESDSGFRLRPDCSENNSIRSGKMPPLTSSLLRERFGKKTSTSPELKTASAKQTRRYSN